MNGMQHFAEASDDDLLRHMVAGDEDAFTVLYRRHQGSVYRFALHMSASTDEAYVFDPRRKTIRPEAWIDRRVFVLLCKKSCAATHGPRHSLRHATVRINGLGR